MKFTKEMLKQIIREELENSLKEEDEFADYRVQKGMETKGEVEGTGDEKMFQNIIQRVHKMEQGLEEVGGIEQVIMLTRRVHALEQALKGK